MVFSHAKSSMGFSPSEMCDKRKVSNTLRPFGPNTYSPKLLSWSLRKSMVAVSLESTNSSIFDSNKSPNAPSFGENIVNNLSPDWSRRC